MSDAEAGQRHVRLPGVRLHVLQALPHDAPLAEALGRTLPLLPVPAEVLREVPAGGTRPTSLRPRRCRGCGQSSGTGVGVRGMNQSSGAV